MSLLALSASPSEMVWNSVFFTLSHQFCEAEKQTAWETFHKLHGHVKGDNAKEVEDFINSEAFQKIDDKRDSLPFATDDWNEQDLGAIQGPDQSAEWWEQVEIS
jgi:hypothetical protein